jgi:hypothetical protein
LFGFSKWLLLAYLVIGAAGITLTAVQWKQLQHRILACCTLLFLLLAVGQTYWGYLHLEQLRQRAAFDYGFEGDVGLLAGIAFVLGCIWSFRDRRVGAFLLTVNAAYLFCVFSLLMSSF